MNSTIQNSATSVSAEINSTSTTNGTPAYTSECGDLVSMVVYIAVLFQIYIVVMVFARRAAYQREREELRLQEEEARNNDEEQANINALKKERRDAVLKQLVVRKWEGENLHIDEGSPIPKVGEDDDVQDTKDQQTLSKNQNDASDTKCGEGNDASSGSMTTTTATTTPMPTETTSMSESRDLRRMGSDMFDVFSGCAICWERFQEGQVVCESINEYCRHVFHEECIQEWLLQHDECPICRRDYVRLDKECVEQNSATQVSP